MQQNAFSKLLQKHLLLKVSVLEGFSSEYAQWVATLCTVSEMFYCFSFGGFLTPTKYSQTTDLPLTSFCLIGFLDQQNVAS